MNALAFAPAVPPDTRADTRLEGGPGPEEGPFWDWFHGPLTTAAQGFTFPKVDHTSIKTTG
jgi:hypothetical protein